MKQYVVYQNPKDFPGKFVVREWLIERGLVTPMPVPLGVGDTIEEARTFVPPGLHCTARHPGDDPVIVEVWL